MALDEMRYVLITPEGEQRRFYLQGIAEMYQGIFGGVLLDTHEDAPKTAVIPFRPPERRTG